jgi:hypothetical protein
MYTMPCCICLNTCTLVASVSESAHLSQRAHWLMLCLYLCVIYVLMQALQSSDDSLLEHCLGVTDPAVIEATIDKYVTTADAPRSTLLCMCIHVCLYVLLMLICVSDTAHHCC